MLPSSSFEVFLIGALLQPPAQCTPALCMPWAEGFRPEPLLPAEMVLAPCRHWSSLSHAS